jgi:UDP-3-O-[3-hydroxymyristoyl] glucosamine N-acyltransferase
MSLLPKQKIFTLIELAQHLGAELIGNPQHQITALAPLQSAGSADLSFIANPAYKKFLSSTGAGAVIVHPDLADEVSTHKLVCSDPYLAFAKLTRLFDRATVPVVGIHATAVIGENCVLGNAISIGAHVVIGDGVSLADGVVIEPGCYVGSGCAIGARSLLHANVTLYHGVTMGADCVLHSGCVIGADGFGFAPSNAGWVKIHQLGGVVMGNRVEVGANTTIDRGALDDTFIDDGVIVDNLVQIGHNVRLGKNTAIAAHTAIAGSTSIGDNCTVAGASAIAGHVTLADKVHITGMSMVSSSITEAGSYSSGIPLAPTKEWRKNAVRFRQLDALATRLTKIERNQKDDSV